MNEKYDHKGYNKKLKELARKLRNNSTPAEIRLWSELLRGRKMKGYQFLRQRAILNYIADFMCKELELIIEVDGNTHEQKEQWENDKVRQQELEVMGFTVLRFTDEQVMNQLDNTGR
ncbi:MAG TPA: endonuclease domain-containing protein [Balneolaceae bacterium]|nr:endonuclease domain-containing protein [Balneolaceae bacterium]